MKIVNFTIMGDPFGKQRPRIANIGGFARAYTPKETVNYESRVLCEYKQATFGDEYPTFDRNESVFCTITAYFKLSKTDYGKKGLNKNGREKMEQGFCTKHLDADNIAKVVLDALNGIAFYDDKQVAVLLVIKKWTEQEPKVSVSLESK